MPRPPRADEAGGLYHALNRGNLRADILRKEGDFVAFEKILHEGLHEGWVESIARRLSLESTIRPRGRQRIRMHAQEAIKDA